MNQRNRNDGLRKCCRCPRRVWAKCPHAWHFNYQWQGTLHRLSLDRHVGRRLRSKTEAEAEADRLRLAIRDGIVGADRTPPSSSQPTFADVAAEYEARHVVPRLSERTLQQHACLRDFLATVEVPGLGGRPVPLTAKAFSAITTDDVERAIDAKATRETKVVQIRSKAVERRVGGRVVANRLHAYLRALWNWAIRKGYVERTPFARAGQPVVRAHREEPRSRRLEGDEETRLLAACSPHLRDLAVAAIETGCRLGELLSLTWGQVRWLQNELFLPAAKTKTRADRHVPISAALREVLVRRQQGPDAEPLPNDAFVFGNEIGEPVGSIKTAWRGACRRAGIENLHFHDLRHEAGSRKLEAGWPLHAVQHWLGHRSVATTGRYLNAGRMLLHELNERERVVQA